MTDAAMDTATTAQRKSARLITLVTFAITALIALVTLFLVPESDKTPIDDYAMPFIAVAAGIAYIFTRRGRESVGILILLIAIGMVCAAYPLAADNIGWQTAIGMLLITTSIANNALPERVAGRISTAAFGFAIAIVLIELTFTGVVSNPVTPSSVAAVIVLAVVYLGILLQRFRSFGLRTKFVTIFILLSVIVVSATAISISRLIVTRLNEKVEQQLTGVAQLSSTSIGNVLTAQIQLLQTLSLDESLQRRLEESNTTNNQDQLQRLDELWRAADAAGDDTAPVVKAVLENEASARLREFQAVFPAHIEILLTDAFGANLAATNRVDDYYQADEEWWQYAYEGGSGGIYISQPAHDETSRIITLQIAVPVTSSDGSPAGVIRSTLDLNFLIPSFQLGRLGETGRTEIYLPGELEIELHEEDGGFELELETAPPDFPQTLAENPDSTFLDTTHEGLAVMASVSPLQSTDMGDPSIRSAFQRLNWRIVIMQDRAEALSAINDVSRAAQLAGLASIVLASLFAVGFTQFLTRPILQLTQAAEEISKGNFNAAAPVESPDEVGVLAASFNHMTSQLADTLSNLEKRIAERTTDLEMARLQTESRAAQLFAIGELSKIINAQQDLNILLPLVTQLVSSTFGFYHIGIFLVDEARQFAILRASNSPGGQSMLKRGHKLEVGGSGIVGHVAKAGAPRIALDVGSDPAFFNNPDLPATRSELALPLVFRERIIGVIDVQSEKPGAFTQEDANILGILSDQIAIAVENTRLLQQAQEALKEVQSLYQSDLREGWTDFAPSEEIAGYQHGPGGGMAMTAPLDTDEIREAMFRGETRVFHADGKTGDPSIAVPIKLREQIIGVIRVQSPARERQWSGAEVNLTETVAERLSLALENARLLQTSQRQAIKEQAISEITGKIGSTINLENVLLTAVEELGRKIPGSEVTIKLKQDDRNDGSR